MASPGLAAEAQHVRWLATSSTETTMPLLDPYFATRRWLRVALIVSGTLAGAVFGVILTRLGKIVTGAPPATTVNYIWNAAVFGLLAGVLSPLITWSVLRRVPLWRTVVEPLVWASAAGMAAIVVGIPAFILILPPAGLVIGILNLHRRYPSVVSRRIAEPVEQELQPAERGALVLTDVGSAAEGVDAPGRGAT